MALPELNQPNIKTPKSGQHQQDPLGPQSLKPKRVLISQAERRISKDNQIGRWPNTKSSHTVRQAGKKNSVASGNDDRESGKRGCSWKKVPATGQKFTHKEG